MNTSAHQSGSVIRDDIQGLRAVAVLSVLVFHLFPEHLTGGYVGVDVFFVISGFLITRMLLATAERDGRISLLDFYARRISRLLPAALLVLFAVIVALPLLPAARWEETVADVVGAALYYINWRQAFLAVDYLGAENAASPVQHFWSLAIEEQFYAVWGVLLVGIGAFAARSRFTFRRVVQIFLTGVFGVSLLVSIWLTAREPESAYFVFHTRAWELALGALLAGVNLPAMTRGLATGLRISGLAMIVLACVAYSGTTAFPGWLALVPTVGAAMIIAAGGRQGHQDDYSARLLATRPMVFIGDISYSLYLWHWPFIVYYEAWSGGKPDLFSGFALGAVSIAVAWVSKVYVEDRFRAHRALPPVRAWSTIAAGTATTVFCVLAGFGFLQATRSDQPAVSTKALSDPNFPGPYAMTTVTSVPDVGLFIPSPDAVKRDLPSAYGEKCHLDIESVTPRPCIRGKAGSDVRIVLAGDSHAANWLPAMEEIVGRNGWYLESHTKSGCALLRKDVPVRGRAYTECREWGEKVLARILETRPSLVIMAQSAGQALFDPAPGMSMEIALQDLWSVLAENKIPFVVIADTPRHHVDPTECVDEPLSCGTERDTAIRVDPVVNAAAQQPSVPLVTMNDLVCTTDFCPAVIGNVIVFRDAHRLTATYSRMLAPFLEARLRQVVDLPEGKPSNLPLQPAPGKAGVDAPADVSLVPPLTAVKRDVPDAYRSKCHLALKDEALNPCILGDPGSSFRVVLAGDSHAVQWLPAFERIATARGIRIESQTKAGCPLVDGIVLRKGSPYQECNRRNGLLLRELASNPPDVLIVTHQARGNPIKAHGDGTVIDVLQSTWQQLQDLGIRVAAIADTPRHSQNPVECIGTGRPCGTPRKQALVADPIRSAVRRDPDVHLVDMNDLICADDFCPATSGNRIIFRDRNHLTATFARFLAPELDSRLAAGVSLPAFKTGETLKKE